MEPGVIEFSTPPSNASVRELMEATFQCSLRETMEPFTMSWWLFSPGSHRALLVGMDDGLGARIANHTLSVGERNLSLTVHDVQAQQNGGRYICRVRASSITTQTFALLEVQCKYWWLYTT